MSLCVIMAVWWYLFRAGVLYQFNDAKERLPHMIVEAGQCVGCVRLPYTHRPHAFQVSQSLHKYALLIVNLLVCLYSCMCLYILYT